MSAPNLGGRLTAVVHYPRLDDPRIDAFRRDHDPFADLVDEHVTLLFPVPAAPTAVIAHTRAIAAEVDAFDLHIVGVRKTWDHWVYLTMQEGREEIVRLHELLYAGPLAAYRRTDLPFEPHIALGFFGLGEYDPLDPTVIELDRPRYETARARAEALRVDVWRRVDTLSVVALDPGAAVVRGVEDVRLG
jgi:2'-5' RNA ligase